MKEQVNSESVWSKLLVFDIFHNESHKALWLVPSVLRFDAWLCLPHMHILCLLVCKIAVWVFNTVYETAGSLYISFSKCFSPFSIFFFGSLYLLAFFSLCIYLLLLDMESLDFYVKSNRCVYGGSSVLE